MERSEGRDAPLAHSDRHAKPGKGCAKGFYGRDVAGENTHHMIEAVFKGAGRALRPALERSKGDVPSTKGVL